MAKILLVEDDRGFAQMVKDWLEDEQYIIECAFDADIAAELLKSHPFDLIILDWNLPDGDGVDICRDFRKQGGLTPILILTGKLEVEDKEIGLDSGADDYLCKPVQLKELSARVRALLRRPRKIVDETIEIKHLRINTRSHNVFVSGERIDLLPKEYALLEFFARNQNHVFSADDLLDRVWKHDADTGPEVIRTTVMRLRKKIDTSPRTRDSMIKTIYGVGYKFETD